MKRTPEEEAALAQWKKPKSQKKGGVGTDTAKTRRRLLGTPETVELFVVGERFTTVYEVTDSVLKYVEAKALTISTRRTKP